MNWLKGYWLAHRSTRKPEEPDVENGQERGGWHRQNPGQNLIVGLDSPEATAATVPLNGEHHSSLPCREWALDTPVGTTGRAVLGNWMLLPLLLPSERILPSPYFWLKNLSRCIWHAELSHMWEPKLLGKTGKKELPREGGSFCWPSALLKWSVPHCRNQRVHILRSRSTSNVQP